MRDKYKLLNLLLKQEVFPIKDSYISYLKDRYAGKIIAIAQDRAFSFYYNDNISLISDYEFDMLLKELESLEEKYPQYKEISSPTTSVGASLKENKFKKVEHAHKGYYTIIIIIFLIKKNCNNSSNLLFLNKGNL